MSSDSRRDQPTCADLVVSLADDEQILTAPARAHVAQCLRCQAELANHRRLRRSMRALASAPVRLDPTLERDIMATLDEHDARRRARRVPGYAAATLGGLAAAAGVIALATRQRRGGRLAG